MWTLSPPGMGWGTSWSERYGAAQSISEGAPADAGGISAVCRGVCCVLCPVRPAAGGGGLSGRAVRSAGGVPCGVGLRPRGTAAQGAEASAGGGRGGAAGPAGHDHRGGDGLRRRGGDAAAGAVPAGDGARRPVGGYDGLLHRMGAPDQDAHRRYAPDPAGGGHAGRPAADDGAGPGGAVCGYGTDLSAVGGGRQRLRDTNVRRG